MSVKRPIIEVKSLSRDFNTTILEGVSFQIYPQEFISILGLSGNGKTTLLKCLTGLIQPTRGRIDVYPPRPFQQLFGFVFQDDCLLPWLTVKENVALGVAHLPRKEKDPLVEEWLTILGIKSIEDNYPSEIQAVMRQKVNIGRGMVGNPMCVVLDQPFSNFDNLTGKSLRDELEWIWSREERQTLSFIMTTNSIEEAVQLSDRIFLMTQSPGRIYTELTIDHKRPRDLSDPLLQRTISEVEQLFAEFQLEVKGEGNLQVPGVFKTTSIQEPAFSRITPLSPADPAVVEGLLSRLADTDRPTDIYELAETLNMSINDIIPAVVFAEQFLQLVATPGTKLHLTHIGRQYVNLTDIEEKREFMKDLCLKIPLIAFVVDKVKEEKNNGLHESVILEELERLLPREDASRQFQIVILWAQSIEVLSYDSSEKMIFYEFAEDSESL